MSSNRKVVPTMTASDWPQAQEVQETHQQLEAQGFALVFITPGERNPMVKGWNTRHHPFEEYQQGQNLGILPGALSGGLVCIDIDEPSLLSLADQYLPETGRVEGRAGKLRSHRYYRVTDLAEHEVAMPQVAGGIGGPRTRQFTDTHTGKRLVDLLGTGACVVCPPSLHQSGERRVWDCEGDPAVVRYADLVQAVENLITAGGLTFKKTQAAMPACVEEITAVDESKFPPMPERVERAQAYLAQMDPAISGQGGHNTTYRAARVVCWDFAVSPEEAWPLLQAYNSRCEPPWSPCDLRHKIEDASNNPGENARGWRLMTEETSMVYGLSESYSESPMPRPQLPHLIGQRVQRGSKMFLDSRRLARKYLDLNGAWLWHNGSPYQYKGTMYQEKTAEDLKFRVREFLEAEFAARNENRGKRNTNRNQESIKPVVLRGNVVGDVVDSLKALVAVDSKTPMPCFLDQEDQYAAVDHVPMQNGILDINSRQMQPHTCEWFCAYCLPFAYDPGKDCPTWMAFLQETLEGDAQRIQLLQQWFGYHFWTGQPLQKFLVMLGQGSDGKSVVGTVLRAVLGKENCSAVSPDYFEKDFGLQPMLNKLANISMEPKDGCQFPEEIIKTIVGGDNLTINRKYLDPLSVPLGAKLTFGTNKLPAVRDLSNGFWRRVMILPFNHSVDESKKRSEFMDEKWWLESGELPGIFNWAMEGLTSLKQARRFVEPCLSKEAVDEYRQDSDLTLSYLLENYKVCKEETQTMEIIYQNYLDHWKQLKTHLSCLGKRKFTQKVLNTFPGVTVEPVYSAVMKKTVRMVKGLQLISDNLVSEQKTISYPTA